LPVLTVVEVQEVNMCPTLLDFVGTKPDLKGYSEQELELAALVLDAALMAFPNQATTPGWN
jgi:hypothetical protein